MHRLVRGAAFAAFTLSLAASPVVAQQALFRLTSQGQGPGLSLDVGDVPGIQRHIAMMLPTAQPSGQYWEIKGSRGGDVRLSNQWSGSNQCLDVDQSGALYMDQCGQQFGQRWQIREVAGQGVQLTNTFKPGHCLDVVAGTLRTLAALVPCSGAPSQLWTVSLTGR